MAKRNPNPPWKKAERRLAYAFGLVRNGGGSGRSAGRVGDTRRISDTEAAIRGLPYPYGPKITFEAKWKGLNSMSLTPKRHTAWRILDELRAGLRGTEDIGTVALFEKGRPGFVACVHSSDLVEFAAIVQAWYAEGCLGPERGPYLGPNAEKEEGVDDASHNTG